MSHGCRNPHSDERTPEDGEEPADGIGDATLTKRGFIAGTSALLGTGMLSRNASATTTEQAAQTQPPATSTATSQDGMVASSHRLATEIGVGVLEDGGNAVDAAVAVQFALNVVQPHTSGIGGGGFMLVYDSDRDQLYAIDNRERAPLGATEDMYLDEQGDEVPFQDQRTNGKSIGVPGTLRACDVALKRFGTKELGELAQPAVDLAQNGVPVDAFLAESIAENVELDAFNQAARDVFAPGGEPLQEGDELVQADLADTLARIRDESSDVFYKGDIGEDLVETVQGWPAAGSAAGTCRFRTSAGTTSTSPSPPWAGSRARPPT
ncbi:gamma-glutamyltransferase [Halobacteriaceae archaeon GCM10025711]